MKRVRLAGGELEVTRVCLGTMHFSPAFPVDAIVTAYLEAGGNFLDTAHCYGFWDVYGAGSSERALAEYFRRHGGRERVLIATKGGHPSVNGYRSTRKYMSAERVRADIDDSLARLECGRIDLYWLHRDDESVPVGDIIDFMNAEIDSGRIGAIGASNWSTRRIEEANNYAARAGKKGFVASQPEFNLASPPEESGGMRFLWREEEIRWHTVTQFPLVAYSASAQGYFAGNRTGIERYDSRQSAARRERARTLSTRYGLSPSQIALSYVTSQGFPVAAIVGTGNVLHLKEAIAATETTLEAKDMRWLAE